MKPRRWAISYVWFFNFIRMAVFSAGGGAAATSSITFSFASFEKKNYTQIFRQHLFSRSNLYQSKVSCQKICTNICLFICFFFFFSASLRPRSFFLRAVLKHQKMFFYVCEKQTVGAAC